MSLSFGMPERFHALTLGIFTPVSLATEEVPPSKSMISLENSLVMPHILSLINLLVNGTPNIFYVRIP